MFRIKEFAKPKLKNVVVVEGLPGIGSVGKIAVDFMIESLDAEKLLEICSDGFPNSVFVNEENLVDMPKVELFYKKFKHEDFIFVTGDVQPVDERACYEFCNLILDIFEKYGGKEIVTLGGIGLPKILKIPKVYCSGNDKSIIKRYAHKKMNRKIFGTVGPIIGVTGLLVGLAGERDIPAIIVLAQTFSHPAYLGVSGAKEILSIFNDKFGLKMSLGKLGKEIKDIEKEIRLRRQVNARYEKKNAGYLGKEVSEGATYIG
ncbi:MAG: PAC2 family protein [Nanoarchaeota archaeon]|nr:PAC2 family protein [Nanoarchaeota archaeon]